MHYKIGTATIDLDRATVRNRSGLVHLREQCTAVLALLMKQPETLITRAELIDQVWDGNGYVGTKAVSDVIWEIRRALEDPDKCVIATIRNRGYELRVRPIEKPEGRYLWRLFWLSIASGTLLLVLSVLWFRHIPNLFGIGIFEQPVVRSFDIEMVETGLNDVQRQVRMGNYREAQRLLEHLDLGLLERGTDPYQSMNSISLQLSRNCLSTDFACLDTSLDMMDSDNSERSYYEGVVWIDQGEYDKAARHFQDLIEQGNHKPDYQAVYINALGFCESKLANYGRAQILFEHAIEVAKSRKQKHVELKALGNLAANCGRLEDYDQAVALYKECMRIVPVYDEQTKIAIDFNIQQFELLSKDLKDWRLLHNLATSGMAKAIEYDDRRRQQDWNRVLLSLKLH